MVSGSQVERHPSAMGIGGPKEGFSVFGLLSGGCSTPMGRRMLRLWFLRPIVNLEVLHGPAHAPSACHPPLTLAGSPHVLAVAVLGCPASL